MSTEATKGQTSNGKVHRIRQARNARGYVVLECSGRAMSLFNVQQVDADQPLTCQSCLNRFGR